MTKVRTTERNHRERADLYITRVQSTCPTSGRCFSPGGIDRVTVVLVQPRSCIYMMSVFSL